MINAVSGYAGGTLPGPSYEQVSSGRTGHAESVEITFDPKQISFGRLLQIYFSVAHDPTQLNRQGPDEGTQYRSEIFATSGAQQQAAEAYIAELDKAKAFAGRIVTKAEPLQAFYRAEPYHQDYATLHPSILATGLTKASPRPNITVGRMSAAAGNASRTSLSPSPRLRMYGEVDPASEPMPEHG